MNDSSTDSKAAATSGKAPSVLDGQDTNAQSTDQERGSSARNKDDALAKTDVNPNPGELSVAAQDMKAVAKFVAALDETTAVHRNIHIASNGANVDQHSHAAVDHTNASDEVNNILDTDERSTILNQPTPMLSPSTNAPVTQEDERIYPGAVAVPGPDAASHDDEYTTTAPASDLGSIVPVTEARLVRGSEEDVEALQEQLRQRDEQLRKQENQLQRFVAERENAAVAQVIRNDEEAQEENNVGDSSSWPLRASLPPKRWSGEEEARAGPQHCNLLGRKRSIVFAIIFGILLMVSGVIVLSVLLSRSSVSAEDETTVPTVPATTAAPTTEPIAAPTTSSGSTAYPTTAGQPVEPAKFPNLSITMLGVTTMDDDSWNTFQEVYKDFYGKYYAANPQFGVTNIETLLEYTSHETARSRRLEGRQLQDQLTVVYNQAITYSIIPDTDLKPADVVTQPFASQPSRDAFAQLLKASYDPAYTNIQSVSPITQAGPLDDDVDGGGLSIGTVVGIAFVVATGLVLLSFGGYWFYKRKGQRGGP